MNSTQVWFFSLAAYFDTGPFRSWIFVVAMFGYGSILCSNVLLILVIWSSRSLHEPMYLFLCSLFVNELYGSTGLFPFLLLQILSDVHTVSVPGCFLQIFLIYTYGNVEFMNLAVMSYDRYLAICCPLQYGSRMTLQKVAALVALVWLFPFVQVCVMISLTASLQLCGNVIPKVYCDNFSVVNLSCSDTSVNNIYGLIYMFAVVLTLIVLILFSYLRILQVCFSGSRQVRQKAISTCSPHLASLLNFSFGCFFEVVQSRFDMSGVPIAARIFLSLYWLTSPPLFNPIMYGLNVTKIRILCKGLMSGSRA